jgi:hypothetical protein
MNGEQILIYDLTLSTKGGDLQQKSPARRFVLEKAGVVA